MPWMIAACGITVASLIVLTLSVALANAPGQSLLSRLSNRALTLTAPDAASTALSTKIRRPVTELPAFR